MTGPGADRVKALFQAAVELPPGQRPGFLDDRCAGDVSLRKEVDALLAHDADGCFLEGPARGPADPVGGPEGVPSRIGRYEIVRVIGEGGMGVVYEALQTNPHRSVALKVIRPGFGPRSLVARFQQEAEVLGQLRHPGITPVYEAGIDERTGLPFLAMELVRGNPLQAYMAQRGLGTRERMALMAQVCDAVQHAHERGVIHRDLKPANILVDERGQPKVLDFGVARVTDLDLQTITLRTDAGQLIGTISYMSPEQAVGDAAQIDRRCDVYALGVILYEAISGRLPVEVRGKTIAEAVRLIREQDPTRLSSINAVFRGDIETIVAKAIDKDKTLRYQSAQDLGADLRRYLRDEPIFARPHSSLYQLRKFARRNRVLVGGVGATILALAAGLAATSVFAARAIEQRRRADLREADARHANYVARIAAAAIALENHDPIRARASLDGAPEALRGWEWHHFRGRLDQSRMATPTGARDLWAARWGGAPDTIDAVLLRQAPAGPVATRWSAASGQRLADPTEDDVWRAWYGSASAAQPWWRAVTSDGRLRAPAGEGGAWIDLSREAWSLPTGAPIAAPQWSSTSRILACTIVTASAFELRVVQDPRTRGVADRASSSFRAVHVAEGDPGPAAVAGESVVLDRFNGLVVLRDDGRRIFTAAGELGFMRDTTDLKVAAPITGHTDAIMTARFSPDGLQVVTGAWDNTVRTWDVATGRPLRVARGHNDGVETVDWSPDGLLIASGAKDGTVRLWDAQTLEALGVFQGHEGPIRSVAFSPDGTRLLSAGADGAARIWSAADRAEPQVLQGHTSYVYPVATSPDPRTPWLVASGGWDHVIRLWDVRSGTAVGELKGHTAPVFHLAFNPDGSRLVSTGLEEAVRVWDLASRREMARLEDATASMMPAAFSKDGASILLPSGRDPGRDGARAAPPSGAAARCWHYAAGSVDLVPLDAVARARCPTVSPDHRLALVRGQTTTIVDLHDGSALWSFPDPAGNDTWGDAPWAFSTDSHRLAIAAPDYTIGIFDARSGRRVATLTGHSDTVFAIVYSPDGSRIASAGRDRAIRLWDAHRLTQVAELRGHTGYIWSLAFSANGSYLVSGSGDHTVRLWDTLSPADRQRSPDESLAE